MRSPGSMLYSVANTGQQFGVQRSRVGLDAADLDQCILINRFCIFGADAEIGRSGGKTQVRGELLQMADKLFGGGCLPLFRVVGNPGQNFQIGSAVFNIIPQPHSGASRQADPVGRVDHTTEGRGQCMDQSQSTVAEGQSGQV